jgi:hypothetical protein
VYDSIERGAKHPYVIVVRFSNFSTACFARSSTKHIERTPAKPFCPQLHTKHIFALFRYARYCDKIIRGGPEQTVYRKGVRLKKPAQSMTPEWTPAM